MSALLELLRGHAHEFGDRPAIVAPGRLPLSYGDLVRHVDELVSAFRSRGIKSDDRIATVLPNGPDLAVAVVATVAAGQCAPLAINHPRSQFVRELSVLEAKALVVQRGIATEARAAAAEVDVPIVELEAGLVAGSCTMWNPVAGAAEATSTTPDCDRIAMLLFTSGTTSTPKLVPLTECSLLGSACTVASTLQLTESDRGLNVMPLFHIHGIVAGLLASLTRGVSVVCTSGFRADAMPMWIEEFAPTWYTAVPAIHQAMLDVARAVDVRPSFRFIRSSSAALPTRVREALEERFGAPVIEAYGMTEAAHQIASNPLPPGERRAGTVGRGTGVEVVVLDDAGNVLPSGHVGEIAIKGPTITSGYLGDLGATERTRVDGWFRTGDQGRVDDDGYLTITGRLRELINRGGEKVAPLEIDEALLEHRQVRMASAFAVPHPRLGEEVAAAVVLTDDAVVSLAELRRFVAKRLEPFKVPRRIVVVDEIPRGVTGKIERRNLAARLGLDESSGQANRAVVRPRDGFEAKMAEVWQRVLGLEEPPDVETDFFDLDGDSLHAAELLTAVDKEFGQSLPATIFFEGTTVRLMCDRSRTSSAPGRRPTIVPIHTEGTAPALFCLLRGGSLLSLRHFVPALGAEQPIYGIWYPAMHGSRKDAGSVEEIASACVASIRDVSANGPYYLFGHSFGGVVMYEVARQLDDASKSVALLALADSPHPRFVAPEWRRRLYFARRYVRRLSAGDSRAMLRAQRREGDVGVEGLAGSPIRLDISAVMARERGYRPGPGEWPVAVFSTSESRERIRHDDLGWASVAVNTTSDLVPGSHDSMLGEPHVHVLASRLASRIQAAGLRTGVRPCA